MRVYLSAAPRARQWCSPDLIAGLEVEMPGDGTPVIVQQEVPDGSTDPDEPHSVTLPRLIAKPTGRRWKNLPWWEVEEG